LIAADGGNLLHPRRNVNFSNNEFNYSHFGYCENGIGDPTTEPWRAPNCIAPGATDRVRSAQIFGFFQL